MREKGSQVPVPRLHRIPSEIDCAMFERLRQAPRSSFLVFDTSEVVYQGHGEAQIYGEYLSALGVFRGIGVNSSSNFVLLIHIYNCSLYSLGMLEFVNSVHKMQGI